MTTVVASAMASLDATVINVALPRIGRDFDAGVSALHRTVSLTGLVVIPAVSGLSSAIGLAAVTHSFRRALVIAACVAQVPVPSPSSAWARGFVHHDPPAASTAPSTDRPCNPTPPGARPVRPSGNLGARAQGWGSARRSAGGLEDEDRELLLGLAW